MGKFYRHEGEELVEAGMEEAERHLSEGFAAMKLKVGLRVDRDTLEQYGRPG